MANPDPSRTEWPTPKRLSETRETGNVLVCPDLTSVIVILSGTLLLFITAPWLADAFRDIFRMLPRIDFREQWSDRQIWEAAAKGFLMIVKICFPVCVGVMLAAFLVVRFQVGKFVSFKPLHWQFNRIWNPKAALKELLPNKTSSVNLLFAAGKVMIVGYMIYLTIRADFGEMLKLNMMPVWSGIAWMLQESYVLIFKIVALMLFLAVMNYWIKRKRYYDALMMTRQEVKDERKGMEGDPHVKAKIRAKMRELFIKSIVGNMKKAHVVITNPTHVAVALRYDPALDSAPIVIEKGLRLRAMRIKELAAQFDIPVVEAPPLARSLYRSCKPGRIIPPEFYRPVAAILSRLQKGPWMRRPRQASPKRTA